MKRLKKQSPDDYILYIVSLSLVSLTILSSLVLTHTTPSAHADASSTATATVSVLEGCSLTSTVDTPHTAGMHNGLYSGTDYASGIGQTTLKAFCNDGSMDFAIYAIGYTNNEYGNTKLHWSGASSRSDNTHDISTGIYNSGTTTNSTWSMKLASVAGTYAPTVTDGTNGTENFTTWHVVPEEYTKVAYKTTGTDVLVNNTGTGSSVTVTYDAYISATQPSGAYIGQVKYTLVHPSTAAAPEPPMLIMQDAATWKNSLAPGQEVQAIDSRDNKVYYVAKLADGKIWMLDNLRLDLSKALPSNSGNSDYIELTTSNTNASAQALSCLLTGSYEGNTCTGSYSTAAVQTKTLSGGSWSNSYNLPYIATSGTCASASYCVHDPSTNQWTADSISPITYGPGSGKIGVYYNYCAASAGSYCYGNGTDYTGSPSSDPDTTTLLDVTEDICPAGWRLPTSSSGGEFQALLSSYSSNVNNFQTALSTPLSGVFYSGTAYYQGRDGHFWSSTWNSTTSMRRLYVDSSDVDPSADDSRYNGFSVRCILGS